MWHMRIAPPVSIPAHCASTQPAGSCQMFGEKTSVRHSTLTFVAAILLLTGCTSVNVRPVSSQEPITSVLIEVNPQVWRSDFVDVLVAGFSRHGIKTRVIQPGTPVGDAYVVRYTARQKWDMAMYMSDATVWIYRNGQEVAKAVYHLKGGGGLALTKWQGTATKIDPVIDQLLANTTSGVGSEGKSLDTPQASAALIPAATDVGLPSSTVDAVCDLPSPVDRAECRGELRFGMTTNEILAKLGPPNEMSPDGTMLRYGDSYLSLDGKSRLVGIADHPPAGL